MSSERKWRWYGEMGSLMEKHLALRSAMGKVSKADKCALYQFNQFVRQHYPKIKVPNRIAILHYLDSKTKLTLSGRRNYLVYIRQFCRFLNQRGIPCYIPDKTLLPQFRYKPRYFAITEEHILEFMKGAREFRKNRPIVGETYSVVLGLLWSTGMRRGEVGKLRHKDIDLEEGTILIRESKFRKTRMIPIDRSVVKVLQDYFEFKLRHGYGTKKEDPVFVNFEGGPLRGNSLQAMFQRLARRRGLSDRDGRYPCLHDLRHCFATRTLIGFYQDPERFPPQSYLPTLATYLGHTNMVYSQYYLHPDFELLRKASERIEKRLKKVA